MQDVSGLSLADKSEIAGFIMRDNLDAVNRKMKAAPPKNTFYTKYVKRAFDIIISFIILVVTLPINLIIAVVTFFDVGNPILFRQTRLGKEMKEFTIYKFRNMTNETDANGALLPPSERVTKWGKFVRKTSLDELLNFVSILNGSMSLVGPRPLQAYYAERLSDRHKMIYNVKPGLECPTPKPLDHSISWGERFDNYVWYAENCSFAVDVKLAFRMVALVFERKATQKRAEAGHGGFLGYDSDGNVIYTKAVPDEYVEEFCKKHGFASLEEAVESRNQKASA